MLGVLGVWKGNMNRDDKGRFKPKDDLPDYIGKKVGEWTVLGGHTRKDKAQHKYWLCECSCGTVKEVNTNSLLSGQSRSCVSCSLDNRRTAISLENTNGVFPQWYLNNVKRRADTKVLKFNLSQSFMTNLYLEQKGLCALTGLEIQTGHKTSSKMSASIDRIDNSVGYIESNVQLLHKDLNRAKFTFTQEEFIEICRAVVRKYGE